MRYEFICYNCGINKIENIKIEDRNENIFCGNCGNAMTRRLSSISTSVQLGCIKSSKVNGVGCYVDGNGKVHPPKSRGEEKTRRFRTNKKI